MPVLFLIFDNIGILSTDRKRAITNGKKRPEASRNPATTMTKQAPFRRNLAPEPFAL